MNRQRTFYSMPYRTYREGLGDPATCRNETMRRLWDFDWHAFEDQAQKDWIGKHVVVRPTNAAPNPGVVQGVGVSLGIREPVVDLQVKLDVPEQGVDPWGRPFTSSWVCCLARHVTVE